MTLEFASPDRFEAISRASPVGIFHADLDGNVEYTNPRLRDMWGLDHDALRGRGWLRRVHPDDAAALLDHWTHPAGADQAHAHRFRLVLPDGSVRWMDGRVAVVCDRDGHPLNRVKPWIRRRR